MVIEIKPDLFEDEIFYTDLRYLIQLCTYEYRYDFHIEFDIVKQTNAFKNLDNDQQQVIEEFYNRSITQSWKFTHKVSESNDQSYSIKEAIKFLEQPFLIFLENSLTDGYFMDCIREHFKKHCKKLNRHKENVWLEYSMGGGSTINKAIEAKLKPFENLSKPNYKYLRCYVLLDSDRSYPTQPYKTELVNLISFLKHNEIPHHILEKREMENYLPDVVFDEIEDNKAFVEAFRRLSPKQKDFFDLEKGFSNNNFDDLLNEIKSLYNNIDVDDKKTFRKGGIQLNGNFKSEFPKFFKSELITRENLLERCEYQLNSNELPDLLKKINELL